MRRYQESLGHDTNAVPVRPQEAESPPIWCNIRGFLLLEDLAR